MFFDRSLGVGCDVVEHRKFYSHSKRVNLLFRLRTVCTINVWCYREILPALTVNNVLVISSFIVLFFSVNFHCFFFGPVCLTNSLVWSRDRTTQMFSR